MAVTAMSRVPSILTRKPRLSGTVKLKKGSSFQEEEPLLPLRMCVLLEGGAGGGYMHVNL